MSSSLLLSSGCARVAVRDTEWCGDVAAGGAVCFHTLRKGKPREIPKGEWDSTRVGMVCGRPKAFADLKAAVIKLCADSPRCSFVTEDGEE